MLRRILNLALWPLRWFRLQLRWRRCRKRGSGIKLLVHNFADLSRKLDRAGCPYVLLRGHPDHDRLHDQRGDGDFDILMDHCAIATVLRQAALIPGRVAVDVYFDCRPSVGGFHYYPPALGVEILTHRTRHALGYWVPDPRRHFLSLAYHVIYHKGLDESLPDPLRDTLPRSGHFQTLQLLARDPDVRFDGVMEFKALHAFLDAHGWSMPRDLLLRWPRRHRLLEILDEMALAHLRAINKTPDRIVLLVRDDANEPAIIAFIKESLETELVVESGRSLSASDRSTLTTRTRGGNWLERRGSRYELIGPAYLFVCRLHNTKATDAFCLNRLPQFKNSIRQHLNARFPSSTGRRFALHAGDTVWDSLECLAYLDSTAVEGGSGIRPSN